MTVNNVRWIVHFTTDLSELSRHNNQKLTGGFYAKYHHDHHLTLTLHSDFNAELAHRLGQTQVINNKSLIHFQKFSEWMRIWLIIPALACWLAFLGEINFILSRVGWDASYIVLQSYIGGYLFFQIITEFFPHKIPYYIIGNNGFSGFYLCKYWGEFEFSLESLLFTLKPLFPPKPLVWSIYPWFTSQSRHPGVQQARLGSERLWFQYF